MMIEVKSLKNRHQMSVDPTIAEVPKNNHRYNSETLSVTLRLLHSQVHCFQMTTGKMKWELSFPFLVVKRRIRGCPQNLFSQDYP
jgi:hypothetical protein